MPKARVMIRNVELRKTRKGDTFASLRVNTGADGDFAEYDAKMWQVDALLKKGTALPSAGDVVEIDYRADEYQGRPQWIVNKFHALDDAERAEALERFRPPTRIDRDFYLSQLDEWIERAPIQRLCGQIVREIYDSAGFRETLTAAPAAVSRHQNYPGGLLEHTLNVTRLAMAMADVYATGETPGSTFNGTQAALDRPLLIAAALLHDVGKTRTHRMAPAAELTESNHWEGHLALSYAMVAEATRTVLDACGVQEPPDEIHKLLHCVLAHHGTLEFGSPVAPACAEAYLLSQADITDARLADIAEAARATHQQQPDARWAPRQRDFPGGIFIGDREA